MNSSVGGALQDQSSAESAEDIFPPTTPAFQKEQITEMVQSLSDKFKIFKQQNTQVGIGGPRSKLNYRLHIVGRPGGGGGGVRFDDNSNNDASFTRDAHDTTME